MNGVTDHCHIKVSENVMKVVGSGCNGVIYNLSLAYLRFVSEP